nr:MAG TPA: zinc-ribbon domain protein [Caudoviricetes sp.]
MNETPKCPYCGAEMDLYLNVDSNDKWNARYTCAECYSFGPPIIDCEEKSHAEEVALAYALHRAEISGDTSDGYHTFNELYDHRAKLFSVIVRNYPELCWKAKKHHDGTMYDGMFIVGINTAEGQASYHYDIDPYWPMFDCQELDRAPEWDGHTPQQAIDRIANLGKVEPENRPLTLEEISEKVYNTDWDFVWLETKGDIFQLQLCPLYVNEEVLGFCWPLSDDEIEEDVEKMGKSWRCWPWKPTPEQMAAEKWEE